ncbi:MAG: DUF1697 domain-containing protein [Rubrivivax sp.]|nr:MAG: DUF1697 domain-containing protein [Rubrivivax sp.]
MRYVALWRGINVGKAKRLAMADLKVLLTELGATNVSTLLNSGNAVFDAKKKLDAGQIRSAVAAKLGVDALVLLKTADEWAPIAADQPIADAEDPSKLLVAIPADAAVLKTLTNFTPDPGERFATTAHAAYLYCGNGILESKLGIALLKPLGAACTTRNWGTVSKLDALVKRT